MRDQSTAPTKSEQVCEQCGVSFGRRRAGQRFCSPTCYQAWWTANRQRELAARGTHRLGELLATPAGERIRTRIAESNRHHPRRPKHDAPPDGAGDAPPLHRLLLPVPPEAPAPAEEDAGADDLVWAERGQYWAEASKRQGPQRNGKRQRTEPTPLVLTGHGVQLQVDNGAMLIRDGFTHYPQQRREWRLFAGNRNLPSRIVVLDGDGALSLDVVAWLARQRIPLLVLDWQGEIVAVLGDGTAPDPGLRAAQLAAQTNGTGLRLATGLIRAKVASSLETIRTLPPSLSRDSTLRKVNGAVAELNDWPPASIEDLRLVEGRAALAYFTAWQTLPLRWKGTGRKPIPPEWQRIGLRQSFVSGTNRHATHPVNAILNYAYAMLEGQMRTATATAGLDPSVGYLHACHPGRPALVYDLMEPLRPHVDRLVLTFLQAHTFSASDVILTERGVCRLHPQLARRVAGLAVGQAVVQEVVTATAQGLTGATADRGGASMRQRSFDSFNRNS